MQNKTFILTTLLLLFCGLTHGQQGVWTQKANFGGTPRGACTSFSIGTKGYVGLGMDTSYFYKNDFWEYDPSLNTWTQKANFTGTARYFAIGFAIGNKGYVGTGNDGSGGLTDFYEYDPMNNSWSQKANIGAGRYQAVGFSIGNKGYVCAGMIAQSDLWEYDPIADTWTQKANCGIAPPFFSGIGFSTSAKGYVGIGASNNTLTTELWEYDPNSNNWTQKNSLPGAYRQWGTAFSIGDLGYVGTGVFGCSPTELNDFWEYNTLTDTWTQKVNFGGTPRNSCSAFSIGAKGYVGLGGDNLYKNDFWEYDPNATAGINEIKNKISLAIYPNPFSTETTLKTTDNFKNATLTIYSVSGQQVKQIKNISGQTIQLQRDNLTSGIYFLRLSQDNNIIAADKLIITD
ncbi:MAG: T9SS type A sorting domain-containing protein [Bacteroidia bacterium]